MEWKFCSNVSKLTQSTSKTELKSNSSNLNGDFLSSIQTLDLRCNYLLCSWDMVTFVHVETAGWFHMSWALTELWLRSRPRIALEWELQTSICRWVVFSGVPSFHSGDMLPRTAAQPFPALSLAYMCAAHDSASPWWIACFYAAL